MGEREREPSRRSLWGLDALNFFLADVRDGMGPYLGIYLKAFHHWDASRVGIALAAMGIASVAAQTPAGAWIDATRWKRGLVVVAAGLVAVGCVSMVFWPTFPVVLAAQVINGFAAAIFAPAIAALSLGLVGHARLARRMGRNEAFNHAGNVVAAVLAGLLSYSVAFQGVFWLVAGMSLASAAAIAAIRGDEIDPALARGADPEHQSEIAGLRTLFADRRIVVFGLSVVLFHFANAAMLPWAGQKLAAQAPAAGTAARDVAGLAMSACIIAAQVVMVPVALVASRLANSWGRKPVFLIGFAVLPIRGFLYTLGANPYFLVAVQLLDGIGAGIFGVVGVLVIADLTRGTGRFNLMQGALATATGIGASLSNLMTGFVVARAGFNAGFLTLSAIAALAFLFYAGLMPETRPAAKPEPGALGDDALDHAGLPAAVTPILPAESGA